jgi:hypothetical protein
MSPCVAPEVFQNVMHFPRAAGFNPPGKFPLRQIIDFFQIQAQFF